MGIQIKERREELGMTQEELSRKSGVSRQTISAIETGKYDNVDKIFYPDCPND